MVRLSKRARLLRDNPNYYRDIRAKRRTYEPHKGQFTSDSSKAALKKRYAAVGPRAGLKAGVQYIGYLCIGPGGYSFLKFKVPIRKSSRVVTNFSSQELARMAQDAVKASKLNGESAGRPAKRTSAGANEGTKL